MVSLLHTELAVSVLSLAGLGSCGELAGEKLAASWLDESDRGLDGTVDGLL